MFGNNSRKIKIKQQTYLIQEQLGQGAFGIVLKCQNEQTNQIVAIKQQQFINENELQMLEKMKGQNFKNLINILEIDYVDRMHYIVMEYCKQSLFDRIKTKGTIKPEDIRFIMKEIGNGIKEIHNLKFAHRDIKPENILIFEKQDYSGKIQEIYKICDFGTIKNINVLQTQKIGTPYYQAPEQLNNSNEYTSKVDIWAFGALIYELLTNVPMFNGYSEEIIKQKILRITQEEIDSTINSLKVERKYKTLLLNMLQIDPQKRHDIEQIVSNLRGESQNITKDEKFNQKQPQPPQTKERPSQFGLPRPNYFQNKNSQDSANINNILPRPEQLKQQFESQYTKQQQQITNNPHPQLLKQQIESQNPKQQQQITNNQFPFQRSRQMNDVKIIPQNSYSLNQKNNQFQTKEIDKSKQNNQFPIQTNLDISQNKNFSMAQNQIPPQQVPSNQRQASPIINLQQSNNLRQNSTNLQNQIHQKNQIQMQQNNYFDIQSKPQFQENQSRQIQNQIRSSSAQPQIIQFQQNCQFKQNYIQNQEKQQFDINLKNQFQKK